MLGAKSQANKQKIYDAKVFMTEQMADEEDYGETSFGDETLPGDMVEALQAEGDEDAALISSFENAALDAVQEDEELAACFNAYQDARRRLQERFRHRGF